MQLANMVGNLQYMCPELSYHCDILEQNSCIII